MRIAAGVRAGEVRAVDVVAAALARIEWAEPTLCAFVEVWAEEALRRAGEVDAQVAAGVWLPLAGVPIGVKGRTGLRTAAARALVAAGCVPVGATSVPGRGTPWQTWGLGSGGRTVNPWRADRTPGGSSAGSAAAVAAGLVPLATGTDGAGSVRIPAAWCGVVGLKTTNGRLPSADRTGLAAAGVLTRHAADAAAYWRCVTGEAGVTGEANEAGEGACPPLTAVWSADLGFADTDAEPASIAHAAALRLEQTGLVRLVRHRPQDDPVRLEDPAPAWLTLRGAPHDDPAAVRAAQELRAENDRRLAALFREADLILTPTTPNAPHGHDGPGDRYSTALTWAFNLSGHPALSIRAGFDADGCPVGLQMVARRGEEEMLLRTASAAEAARTYPERERENPA
ncbi:amidase family protein [Streptomyces sp. SP17KL33]|uniref:amidase family protein n=1 Tax=Streptomyces sp. SP17KL33 TaxID=3002534 RepID=UPI002E759F6D|nr:amidase family protein [Streptomyces sp. SP17KL33]MEE1830638.1 amidase family protein [Streptomyces sp. SP17KL33]